MFVRITLVAGALLAVPLPAAPPLTTIQDVLYRADGTRFNGTVQINWNSFEASDTSNISMQSLSVHIVDGSLRVQLVPNANAVPSNYYTVKYNSDGKVQFQETWSVPSSATPVRVRDVRVATPSGGIQGQVTAMQESDITGLVADLASRPIKGSGFTPGHTVMVDSAGLLQTVTGDPGDCVHVDGTSGPCSVAPSFVDGETPGGIVDGSNASFTLVSAPNPPTALAIFRNGILQKPVQDYTVANSTVQFVTANIPQPGDTLQVSYRTGSGQGGTSNNSFSSVSKQSLALPAMATPGAPQVLCAGTGDGSAQASCPLAAGTLQAGDRVEIRFDYARSGTSGSFTWEIRWGSATAASGNASDTAISGRVDAAVHEGGTQLSWQSWGAAVPASNGVANAANPAPPSIDFRGTGAVLHNFTVLRYPRTT